MQTSPEGERPVHRSSTRIRFTSPPTITFTEGPERFDPSRFLAELKRNGVDDAGIGEADIRALQRNTPLVMDWLGSHSANLERFATDPSNALQAILPVRPPGAGTPGIGGSYRLRVTSPRWDAEIKRLTLDVLSWAERSPDNLRRLAENPTGAVEAVATDEPRAVVEATIEALTELTERVKSPPVLTTQHMFSVQRTTRREL